MQLNNEGFIQMLNKRGPEMEPCRLPHQRPTQAKPNPGSQAGRSVKAQSRTVPVSLKWFPHLARRPRYLTENFKTILKLTYFPQPSAGSDFIKVWENT